MADFRPLPLSSATLGPSEMHLCSFYGQTYEWMPVRKYLLFGPALGHTPIATTPILFWRGHITSDRFLLEFPDIGSPTIHMVLRLTGGVPGHMAGQVRRVTKKLKKMADGAPVVAIERQEIVKFNLYDEVLTAVTRSHRSLDEMIPFAPISIDDKGEPNYGDRAGSINVFPVVLRKWFEVEGVRDKTPTDDVEQAGTSGAP